MDDLIGRRIEESVRVIRSVMRSAEEIKRASSLIAESFSSGGKLLIFGNGGSAADSQHLAAELVGRFKKGGRAGFPAIALVSDVSVLTAVSNDWDFSYVFERQIEALGRKEDVAFGISTSGRSKNVLRGLSRAKEMGLKTIALVGRYVDEVKRVSDVVISVDSPDTQRIQEAHTLVIHLICELIEKNFY